MEFARYFRYDAGAMPQENIIDKIGRLPLGLKLAGFGSLFTFLSVFLPWYADIDTFNTGEKYIGLSGPLYLLGFLIFALAVSSLFLVGFRLFGKKLPKIPLEEAHFHIFVGAMSLFLLVITSSIYFHPKFGVNITMKEMKFGMIMSFIGTISVLLGGIKLNKDKGVSFDIEGKLNSLIDLEESRQRTQKDIKITDRESSFEKREAVSVNVETLDRADSKELQKELPPENQNLF